MNVTAQQILTLAASYIGVKESPAHSNNVIFNTLFYGDKVSGDYPWCCVFIWYLFNALHASEIFCGGIKTASCSYVQDYAVRHGQWITRNFQPGDIVIYNWNADKKVDHIGIVESISDAQHVVAIEGNTSIDSNSNGGEVMRRPRNIKYVEGAYRPTYEEEDDLTKYIEQIATKAGVSTAEVVTRLACLVQYANPTEEKWESDGYADLKNMGIVSGERKGNQPVFYGELGIILKRFKEAFIK